MRVKEVIAELSSLPFRRNSLKRQRLELGLSRAALARILEVDPSTIYRQELHNPMSMLWHYALRGIDAEATSKFAKQVRRKHRDDLARSDQLTGATMLDAMNQKHTAEMLRKQQREHARVDAVVERAIKRSEANKKK